MKQYNYKLVAIAGTFDRLHKGHKYFISEAFKLGHRVIIGLTSDAFVQEKLKTQNSRLPTPGTGGQAKLKTNVNSYEIRKNELKDYLRSNGLLDRAEVVMIDDIYGPAIVDKEIEALVVTTETLEGADRVNEKRQTLGLTPLKILQIPLILAEDHHRIASTRIRQGEIDRLGRVFNQIFKFSPVSPGEAGRAIFKIPEDLRQELKKPLGKLIEGDSQNLHQVADKLKETVKMSNPVLISTVGDEVTKLCNEVSITVNLAIFDYCVGRKEKYHSLSELGFKWPFTRPRLANGLVAVKNPAGHITNELVNAVKKAYLSIIKSGKQRMIQVYGEEDLAGVPAILLAPLGTLVLYGQPAFTTIKSGLRRGKSVAGVVLVEVTEEKKKELLDLINYNIDYKIK